MALFYGDQKVCPVIKVESAVPTSTGYTFTMNMVGDAAEVSWVINDSITNNTSSSYSIQSQWTLVYPNVETIRFSGSIEPSYTTGTIYIGGVAQALAPNITYTLQSDNDHVNINFAMCLTGDTYITLSNGGCKRIDRLKVGDKLLSINPETGNQEEDTITSCDSDQEKYGESYDIWSFETCYNVKTVNRHRFYNIERGEFVYLNEWNIGEHTITQEGKQVALLSHQTVEEEVRHFTLFTEKWNNYYANGLLSGNRYSTIIGDLTNAGNNRTTNN